MLGLTRTRQSANEERHGTRGTRHTRGTRVSCVYSIVRRGVICQRGGYVLTSASPAGLNVVPDVDSKRPKCWNMVGMLTQMLVGGGKVH